MISTRGIRASPRRSILAVDIVGVTVVAEYRLRLSFEDATVGEVDFNGRKWRRLSSRFGTPASSRVAVDPEFTWPNGVDMAPEPLNESASLNPASVSARG